MSSGDGHPDAVTNTEERHRLELSHDRFSCLLCVHDAQRVNLVSLRAELQASRDALAPLLKELADLRECLERAERERDEARRKLGDVSQLYVDADRARLLAEGMLRAVSAGPENVWRWQGDGNDYPESLSCPVVMLPDTLRAFVALKRDAEALAKALELACAESAAEADAYEEEHNERPQSRWEGAARAALAVWRAMHPKEQ